MSIIKDQNKRIVILGHSPLPFENVNKNYAPGSRTWHFTYCAMSMGYEVLLIASRIPFIYEKNIDPILFQRKDNLHYYSVEDHIFANKNWMIQKINQFKPDCIAGITSFPASVASDLNLGIPFWADLYGSVMSEAQAKAYVFKDDSHLHHFFQMESKVLDKADVFSVVSEAQGFSLIGELGIWGRLNKDTLGYRFVRVIPATAEIHEFNHTKNVIRGVLAKQDDFVILYSGGYNTWTDVNTLFYGLEKAMSKDKSIVFVSTGGQIEGHDDITYANFKNLINKSSFKNRFHLCGWVPKEDVANYYLESDLGINVDTFTYEAILGSRTRVLDWLRASLTFISTPLSEITNYLIENQVAYGFQPGNSEELARQLLLISSNRDELTKRKSRIKNILSEEFTYEHTSKEFLNWLQNPQHAPDHGQINPLVSRKSRAEQMRGPHSISFSHNMASSSWPIIVSFLRMIGLEKYQENIKKLGSSLIYNKINEQTVNELKKYRGEFVNVSLPEMKTDSFYSVKTTIKNTGKKTWKTPNMDLNPVNVSYMWKDSNGNIVIREGTRSPLTELVKPRKQIKLNVDIVTPKEPGDYILEIHLVKEYEFWFNEGANSKPFIAKVSLKKKETKVSVSQKLPVVSVIVVTYNGEKYVDECLNALMESDYPSFEIIVVDNNSRDGTLTNLQKYQRRIKLIENNKNLGFAEGNNIGIKQAKGDIIILINQDAIVNKHSIKELVLPFLEDDKIMITGSKILYPGTTKIQSAGGILQKNGLTNHIGCGEEDHNQYDVIKEVDYITGAAMAIHRNLFEKTNLFSVKYKPAYFEELEKCLQARKLNYKVVFVPTSVVYHHESTTFGALSTSFLKHYHTNRFRFIYRNYSFKDFVSKFIPSELKWFFKSCNPNEWMLVIRAHLKAIISFR